MSRHPLATVCVVLLGSALLLSEAAGACTLGVPRTEARHTVQMPAAFPPFATRDAPIGRCSRAERRRALSREQRLVLARLGPLSILRNEADLAMLAVRGWGIPAHGFTSLGGMGFTVSQTDLFVDQPPVPGNPHLLFYEPNREAKDVTDSAGSDFPYRLRGWGYITWYDYDQHPTGLPCMARRDWFIHERGVHTLDGGMEARPPKEDVHGTAPGNVPPAPSATRPGGPHPRWWDIHFWRRDRVPAVSLLNPGRLIRGIDPRIGELFYYPPPRRGGS